MLSFDAVTMRLPLGEKAADLTGPSRPFNTSTCVPVVAFQTRAVPSSDAVTMRVPWVRTPPT